MQKITYTYSPEYTLTNGKITLEAEPMHTYVLWFYESKQPDILEMFVSVVVPVHWNGAPFVHSMTRGWKWECEEVDDLL